MDQARRRPLRLQLTRFFGRDGEAGELVQLLQNARLVTLVGAPGCGKTRLGVEVAQRLAPELGHGAHIVELAPLASEANVAAAVGAALGIAEQPGESSIDTLSEALSEADLLLVLDNCEHLVRAVGKTLEPLLQTCPKLRVLATSRTPLRLAGEQVWPVPPLDEQAAVELFEDRAELANSGFHVDAGGRDMVRLICNRLDRLPLALELTAAWTRVLSPLQIVERLDDALPLMSDGAHRTAARHETMKATVDWSLRLLTNDDQQLFERLSVFAGGFDLAAVDAVSDADGDALRGLTTLVDHSLVLTETVSDESMRYRLLEPVRQCGAERLAKRSETEAVRQRHAEHYVTLTEHLDAQLRASNQSDALARMDRERNNFRVAFDWARAHDSELGLRLAIAAAHYFQYAGVANQGREWLGEMLAVAGQDPALRAAGLGRLGRLAWRQGDYGSARSHLQESLALLRELDDELAVARRLRNLGLVALSEGDFSAGAQLCDQAIAMFRRSDDKVGLGWALIYRGWIHHGLGDLDAGDECMWEAIAIGEATTHLVISLHGRSGLAYSADARGDVAAERKQAEEACATRQGFDHPAVEPECLWSFFRLASAEGRGRTAVRLAGAAFELGRATGSIPSIPLMADIEPRLHALRAQFGPALADRLLARGAEMGLPELFDEAIELPVDKDSPLSVREAEVADLVGQGLSNVEIGEKLFISRRTVETHLEHIRQKLGLGSRHEILLWVLRNP